MRPAASARLGRLSPRRSWWDSAAIVVSVSEQLANVTAFIRSGNRAAAQATVDRILRRDPDEPNALRLFALLRAQDGDLAAAIKCLERVLEIAPGFQQAARDFAGFANIALDRDALDDAERLPKRAMAISPNVSHVHRARARLAMSRSRYPEAEAAAKRATEINPELAESWTTLGTV